jgi:hypothetical protein
VPTTPAYVKIKVYFLIKAVAKIPNPAPVIVEFLIVKGKYSSLSRHF